MSETRTHDRLEALIALARSGDVVPELPSGADALFERISEAVAPADPLRALLGQAREVAGPSIQDPDALFARISAQLGAEAPAAPQAVPEVVASVEPVDLDTRLDALVGLARTEAVAATVADPEALYAKILDRVAARERARQQVDARLGGMLTAARVAPASPASDALFAQIERGIAADQVDQRLSEMTQTARRAPETVWMPEAEPVNDTPAEVLTWSRPAVWTAVAAVALACLTWWLVRPGAPMVDVPVAVERPELTPALTTASAVQVFASDDASWTLTGTTDYVLTIERGDALIEFVPTTPEDHLRVTTPHTSIDVVGTAFYVTTGAEGETVTVVTGAVEVEREGTQVRLETNQRLNRDAEVDEAPAELREALTAWVDPEVHQARLDAARGQARVEVPTEVAVADPATPDVAPDVVPQPEMVEVVEAQVEVPTEVAPEAPEAPEAPAEEVREVEPPARAVAPEISERVLREAARQAAAEGRWAEVAAHDELLLDRLPHRSDEAATLRLELARLYLNELHSPRRAERHMERYLRYHPDDVAYEAVRGAYCELIAEHGRESGYCE